MPFTFFARSETQRSEFLKAQQAVLSSHVHNYVKEGVLSRHHALVQAAKHECTLRFDALWEIYGEISCHSLAQIIHAAQLERSQEIDAIKTVLSVFDEFRQREKLTSETTYILMRRLTFEEPLGLKYPGNLPDIFRFRAKYSAGNPAIRKVCTTLSEQDEKSLVPMALLIPEWLSLEEVEDDPNWAVTQSSAQLRDDAIRRRDEAGNRMQAAINEVDRANGKIQATRKKLLASDAGVERGPLEFWNWVEVVYPVALLYGELGIENNETPLFQQSNQYLENHWIWQLFFANFSISPEELDFGVTTLIERPRSLCKWKVAVGTEVEEFRKQLLRLAEVMCGGIRNTVQFRHLQREFAKKETPLSTKVYLVSQLLAFSAELNRERPSALRDLGAHSGYVVGSIVTEFEKATCQVSTLRLETPDDLELNRMLAEEVSEAEAGAVDRAYKESLDGDLASAAPTMEELESPEIKQLLEEMMADMESACEDEPTVHDPEVEIGYVFNMDLGHIGATIRTTQSNFESDLDAFLIEHKIETIVPVNSISGAIYKYIFESDETERKGSPMAHVAGRGWHKIKRGRQRICVLEEDGRYLLHLLKRKEWEYYSP